MYLLINLFQAGACIHRQTKAEPLPSILQQQQQQQPARLRLCLSRVITFSLGSA